MIFFVVSKTEPTPQKIMTAKFNQPSMLPSWVWICHQVIKCWTEKPNSQLGSRRVLPLLTLSRVYLAAVLLSMRTQPNLTAQRVYITLGDENPLVYRPLGDRHDRHRTPVVDRSTGRPIAAERTSPTPLVGYTNAECGGHETLGRWRSQTRPSVVLFSVQSYFLDGFRLFPRSRCNCGRVGAENTSNIITPPVVESRELEFSLARNSTGEVSRWRPRTSGWRRVFVFQAIESHLG